MCLLPRSKQLLAYYNAADSVFKDASILLYGCEWVLKVQAYLFFHIPLYLVHSMTAQLSKVWVCPKTLSCTLGHLKEHAHNSAQDCLNAKRSAFKAH